jgi:hypothetical protein
MRLCVPVLSLALAGCSATAPVLVVQDDGATLRGTATASLHGGKVHVERPGLSCSGSYRADLQHPTLTVPMQCSDGTTGIALVERDPCMCSGQGIFRTADGREARFYFGDRARAHQ